MQPSSRLEIKRDHRGRDATRAETSNQGADDGDLSSLKKFPYRDAVAVAHLLLGRVRVLIAIYAVTAGAMDGNQIMFPCLLRLLLDSLSMVHVKPPW